MNRVFLAALVSVSFLVPARATSATVEEARTFVASAERTLLDLWIAQQRAAWVKSNFITDDTAAMEAQAVEEMIAAGVDLALQARRFEGLKLPAELARKIYILRTSFSLVAPRDPAKQKELSEIASWMDGEYGKGKYCPAAGKECLDVGRVSERMAVSRDPKELLDLWIGWHKVGTPLRGKYERFVRLANEGARELGFKDLGALWRANYDMPPDEFAAELDRLWLQVRPLYERLHCYARGKLAERYGKEVIADGKPIPAHLLGNIWAQEWGNIYDLVKPEKGDSGYDLTDLLAKKKVDELAMVRIGERFFTSLGFDPLPATFWERSLFTQPRDRDVVCHASAWNIDFKDDLRIKMCIRINEEDFRTIHHELGHNFYQRAYRNQPPLFADGANDGFHEGIGDAVALSVTPGYLKKIGLLKELPPESADLGFLLRGALDKVAFLPFGLVIDNWRWKVFSGELAPASYNRGWWDLRLKYQGVAPPTARGATAFDPGAKYHVPANVPYMRYFLGHILQFQFHRAMCKEAGWKGPLHRCSIYGSREAGEKLIRMLELGRSRPWQEALYELTGERQMDATAILDYFQPLSAWLDERNKGQSCGW